MKNSTPVESPCQEKDARPLRQGTILHCSDEYCRARWRCPPRTPARTHIGEYINDLVATMCPGCGEPTGEPVSYRRRADLTFGEMRATLEGAGFVRSATTAEGEEWEHRVDGADKWVAVAFHVLFVDGVEALHSPIGWIRVSQFYASYWRRGEPERCGINMSIRASQFHGDRERLAGRAWPIDRHSFAFHLRRALAWMAR